MKKKTGKIDERKDDPLGIRESKLTSFSGKTAKPPRSATETLVHDLQVHQVELEMQNEELRRSQQELESQRKQYFELYNGAPVGYVTLNKQGLILDANRTMAEFLGLEIDALINKSLGQFIRPESQDTFFLHRKVVIRSPGGHTCDLILKGRNGNAVHVQVNSARAEIEGCDLIRSTMTDITARKEAEEALRTTEQLYRAMGEAIDYGVWICTPEGGNVYVSDSFLEMVGITQEQCSGYGWSEMLHPDDAAKTMAQWRKCIQTGEALDIEHRFRGLDGQWHPVLARGVPVRNNLGEIVNWAGINLDISRLKFVEDALRETLDEVEARVNRRTLQLSEAYKSLQREMEERIKMEIQLVRAQKLEALGTLAGGIAHDFNNILAGIIGFIELALEKVDPSGSAHKRLELALKGAYRGRDLVKQILDFSRQTEPEKKPIALSHVVEEGLKLLKPVLPSMTQITLQSSTDDDIIQADASQILQVLTNLCTNAVHAMGEKGGPVDIVVSKTSFPEGYPTPFPEMVPGEYVVLEVIDVGRGMTPEILDHIFDPFFTTKSQWEGTGLGLSVVHGIVRNHDGYATVESKPGKGTTFRIYFPKTEGHVITEERESLPAEGKKERILFVDDEDILVELEQHRLSSLGYEVVTTTNSIEALSIFREDPERFDLVITDNTMPNMTGIVLAAELLQTKPTMPIILCTGHSENVSSVQAQEAGISAFLMKPVGKHQMARTIRRVLDGKPNVH